MESDVFRMSDDGTQHTREYMACCGSRQTRSFIWMMYCQQVIHERTKLGPAQELDKIVLWVDLVLALKCCTALYKGFMAEKTILQASFHL